MHIPKYFEITDKEEILSFVQANAFGQLISHVSGRIFSTHMPFLLSNDNTKMLGHLAGNNPQCNELDGQEVMITLEGPHDYISPSWYKSPGVPTWNYQAVHIYGRARIFTDLDRLQYVVDKLTEKYESLLTPPWQPEYNNAMLKAIVGVEISIDDIQCQYKLSQNRSAEDREQVIDRLCDLGSIKLAEAMKRVSE
ncbi:FMN-binding negative transcriptional regulator [Teredinibacter sp. KSP-S5-2]|uniref:FMN-binding negative transcriptional regulator n=1 Tax=Teredinibacter sp. KSP-S5-2 TaxID=3034506 RepID=UPI0029341CD3|nr:FMN-binding negative transcriptional regulator [Teredinibacter sp. KSP-S5-2]WNO07950.1 FMN-binding negative transcriptional regulator [Teredinibacter sp. KSP-S5-2]